MNTIIKAENLSESLFVLEKSTEFKTSMFSTVYHRAFLLRNSIIHKSSEMEERRKEGFEIRSALENIISFQGRRGTGKTSAMLSVYNELKNFSAYASEDEWRTLENDKVDKNVSFVAIDYIDASMLERGEDILELIIANMFSMLQEYDAREKIQINFENRALYEKFSEVFGILTDVKRNIKSRTDLSSLQKLAQVSNSQVLGSKVEDLIHSYLRYIQIMRKDYSDRNTPFLVIAIDDVDMHFQKDDSTPFELLETLHRYLMIPNVIILLTYDYQNLCRGCEKHFLELVYEKGNFQAEDTQYVKELAVEYLNKVLPKYRRVHMPSLRKRDYEESQGSYVVRVCLDKVNSTLKEFVRLSLPQDSFNNKYVDLPVKKFSLLLKASVAGLFYDAMGNKRHFSEPLSLRELAQLYVFYGQLNEMIQTDIDDAGKWNVVYKEVLDDLYFRFATEKLNRTEMYQFEKYLDVKIERRSRDIIQEIRRQCKLHDSLDFSKILYIGQKKFSYSYGELLYGLYTVSSQGWFSKSLVHCILDSYTIMLTKLYRNMKIYAEKLQNFETGSEQYDLCLKEYKENKARFTEVMGASISSSWSNLLMPRFKNVPSVWGGRETEEDVNDSKIVSIGAIKFTSFEDTFWEFELKTGKDAEMEDVQKEQLQMIEILCMFYTDIYEKINSSSRKKGFSIIYMNKEEKNKGIILDPALEKAASFKFKFNEGCYNILNFVNTLFEGKVYFDTLHDRMKQAWIEYWEEIGKIKRTDLYENKEAEILAFFKKNSICQEKEYMIWEKKSYGLALPIYSFDMMYNLLKRCYLNQGFLGVIPYKGEILVQLQHLLNVKLGKLLYDEDVFYFGNENTNKNEERFYNTYKENPFLRYINNLNLDEKKDTRREFEKHLKNMLKGILKGRDDKEGWHIS